MIQIIMKTEKQLYFIADISFYIATVDFTDYSPKLFYCRGQDRTNNICLKT